MKGKDVKQNKKQVKMSKKKKHESKVREQLEDDGVDYEEELKKVRKWKLILRNVMNFHMKKNLIN